jgi:DNA-binding transcriptional MerR regulator
MSGAISAQELIQTFGISYQTLNYYTNLGLLHSIKRKGNKRLYVESDVKERLQRIDRLKDEGYPLKIIAQMLNGR